MMSNWIESKAFCGEIGSYNVWLDNFFGWSWVWCDSESDLRGSGWADTEQEAIKCAKKFAKNYGNYKN